jgi:hypothetical protein
MQQAPVNNTKGSERTDSVFLVSQCFYAAADFSRSVNLALVQKERNQRGNNAREISKRRSSALTAGPRRSATKNRSEATWKNEKGPTPKKIAGLGDGAYWVSNRFGGVHHVLKGDAFISVGLGRTDGEATKSVARQINPGMPLVTVRRVNSIVHLAWSEADTGNGG